jgi:DNA-3-methyladenine glycosylase II
MFSHREEDSRMTIHLNSQSDLEDAIAALVRQDRRLKPILELTGMPALRQRAPGFAAWLRSCAASNYPRRVPGRSGRG